MARTILAIAREAAERDATAPAPTSLFNTNNRIARILRTAAKDTLREYLRSYDVIGTSEFQSTWVLTLVPGRFAYQLPPDFLRIIANTEHRSGWPMGLMGPASPQTWAAWLYGGSAAPVEMGWRIQNGVMHIMPTPKAYELVTIDYISRFPVVSPVREGDYDFSVSPPVCNLPFVPREGFYDIAQAYDASENIDGQGLYDLPPGWDVAIYGPEIFDTLRRLNPKSARAPLPQVRREAFEADGDMPAFDDDHVLSLGMSFRLRKALGMDYAEVAAEYEAEMENKAATDAGGQRPFRLGANRRPDDVVPLGNGQWLIN